VNKREVKAMDRRQKVRAAFYRTKHFERYIKWTLERRMVDGGKK
jgi:hypothetical protein